MLYYDNSIFFLYIIIYNTGNNVYNNIYTGNNCITPKC